jgi:nicotinamidase-related amidase
LLDYQRALCEAGENCLAPPLAAQVEERGTIAAAARVLAAFRASAEPIFHVRLAFEPTYALRGNRHPRFDRYVDERLMLRDSREAEIVDDLAPRDGEPVVDKGTVDPFVGTSLLPALSALGVSHVVMGGVATNLVVESAARHACDAGLQVSVVSEMCASFDPGLHELSLSTFLPMFATVTSLDALLEGVR